ncbi:MAG: hypothetical protein HWN66_11580 [Candidatus Helarchaeota archaeon]|nr:hypothetical protein [Candidatus Helarchaeota archaeon]
MSKIEKVAAVYSRSGPLKIGSIEGYLKRQVRFFTKDLKRIRIFRIEIVDGLAGIIETEIEGPFKTFEFNLEETDNLLTIILQYEPISGPKGKIIAEFEKYSKTKVLVEYRSEKWIKKETKEMYYVKVLKGSRNREPEKLEFEFSPMKIEDFKQTKYYYGENP